MHLKMDGLGSCVNCNVKEINVGIQFFVFDENNKSK